MEIFINIPGYEGYKVSNYGLVISIKKSIDKRWKVLKPRRNNKGYDRVALRRHNKTKEHLVHRLVADSFGLPKKGDVVNHINGDKLDNRLGNLEWVTPKENIQHAMSTGLCTQTGRPVSINFDESVVVKMLKDHKTYREIAKELNINYDALHYHIRKKQDFFDNIRWTH